MKFRNATELQDFLDDNLSRRKRELTTLRFSIQSCRRDHERNALLRAALPLLYAHWEGFIKISSTAYLSYVSHQGVLLKNLHFNFVALACRSEILAAAPTKKVGMHKQIITYLMDNLDHTVALATDSAIDTERNLSSSVLKDIMGTIGINYDSDWEKKSLWIDHQLLKGRDEVVHGELVPIEFATYEQLHHQVVDSLDEYKAAIENAVALKAYIKTV